MTFNEDSRVKIPTILHLMRLGYKYQSLKGANWDESTNIFTEIFNEKIQELNPDLNEHEIEQYYKELSLTLENEDLGRSFYEKLVERSDTRIIDFEDFENNDFRVVTELPCKKDDEEFRPDIILLINGMPLAFIEVKKPNNRDGILAEHKRIQTRFQNKKFRKFVNITQFRLTSAHVIPPTVFLLTFFRTPRHLLHKQHIVLEYAEGISQTVFHGIYHGKYRCNHKYTYHHPQQ